MLGHELSDVAAIHHVVNTRVAFLLDAHDLVLVVVEGLGLLGQLLDVRDITRKRNHLLHFVLVV